MSSRGKDESFASLFEQSHDARTGRRRHHVGDTIEVTVVAVGRESVFADLGAKQEGYFERTDLVDPSGKLRVEVGAKVTATVRAIDQNGQVALAPVVVKDARGETTATIASEGASSIVEGARVRGKITGIERYGVFVQIEGTQGRNGRGLVPVSETATSRGADLKKHFSVGQDVEVKILSVAEDGKIRMSISALAADDDRALLEAYRAREGVASSGADESDASATASAKGGAKTAKKSAPEPRGFGTLGDLLTKKKR